MNIQAVRSLVTEVSARINPLSPSSLIDQVAPAASSAGGFQRNLLAVAGQLMRDGNRRMDHPSATPQDHTLPEGIDNADVIMANASLSNDWTKLAANVIALREALAVE